VTSIWLAGDEALSETPFLANWIDVLELSFFDY
jgi:hypothetical protein